jgi:hypothetical protein
VDLVPHLIYLNDEGSKMKTNKTVASGLVLAIFFSGVLLTSNVHASGKQKPPVTKSMTASSWYQPVFDFFTFA